VGQPRAFFCGCGGGDAAERHFTAMIIQQAEDCFDLFGLDLAGATAAATFTITQAFSFGSSTRGSSPRSDLTLCAGRGSARRSGAS